VIFGYPNSVPRARGGRPVEDVPTAPFRFRPGEVRVPCPALGSLGRGANSLQPPRVIRKSCYPDPAWGYSRSAGSGIFRAGVGERRICWKSPWAYPAATTQGGGFPPPHGAVAGTDHGPITSWTSPGGMNPLVELSPPGVGEHRFVPARATGGWSIPGGARRLWRAEKAEAVVRAERQDATISPQAGAACDRGRPAAAWGLARLLIRRGTPGSSSPTGGRHLEPPCLAGDAETRFWEGMVAANEGQGAGRRALDARLFSGPPWPGSKNPRSRDRPAAIGAASMVGDRRRRGAWFSGRKVWGFPVTGEGLTPVAQDLRFSRPERRKRWLARTGSGFFS